MEPVLIVGGLIALVFLAGRSGGTSKTSKSGSSSSSGSSETAQIIGAVGGALNGISDLVKGIMGGKGGGGSGGGTSLGGGGGGGGFGSGGGSQPTMGFGSGSPVFDAYSYNQPGTTIQGDAPTTAGSEAHYVFDPENVQAVVASDGSLSEDKGLGQFGSANAGSDGNWMDSGSLVPDLSLDTSWWDQSDNSPSGAGTTVGWEGDNFQTYDAFDTGSEFDGGGGDWGGGDWV